MIVKFIINLMLTMIVFATYGLTSESNTIGKYSIGFEEIHQMGIKGKGQTVILLEPNFTFESNHPAFKRIEVQCIDVGRHPKCPEGFKDLSTFRYHQGFKPFGLDFMNDQDHCQKVLSVLVGIPCNNYNYGGGIVPEAKPILVSCSHASITGNRSGWVNSIIRCASSAVYTFAELNEFLLHEDHPEMLEQALTLYPEKNLLAQKIDDSIFDAFKIIFDSPGRVINASFDIQTPIDYLDTYKLTSHFLDFIAEGLERTDKILIFCAKNESADISSSIFFNDIYNPSLEENINLEYREKIIYENNYIRGRRSIGFQQYANHPVLKSRVRIVTNLMLAKSSGNRHFSRTNVSFKNGNSFDVELSPTSNYPGDDKCLQAITLTAFGSNLMVAASGGKFITESGTSLSAPTVVGLITLMDEHYNKQGCDYSGLDLLNILDSSCLLPAPGHAMYYGNGIIDPLSALGIQEYKGSEKGVEEDNCIIF